MTNDTPLNPLTTQAGEPTMVLVESKPFADFDHWMDEQLDDLVARWVHAAAPNAARASRVTRGPAK